jgi:hypothetical protein
MRDMAENTDTARRVPTNRQSRFKDVSGRIIFNDNLAGDILSSYPVNPWYNLSIK